MTAIKEIKIELRNVDTGKLEVYKTNFVSARKVRQGLKVSSMAEKEGVDEGELIEEMVKYVASIFDDVTDDMIWDGLASWNLISELERVVGEVMGADTQGLEKK